MGSCHCEDKGNHHNHNHNHHQGNCCCNGGMFGKMFIDRHYWSKKKLIKLLERRIEFFKEEIEDIQDYIEELKSETDK